MILLNFHNEKSSVVNGVLRKKKPYVLRQKQNIISVILILFTFSNNLKMNQVISLNLTS